MASTTTCRNHRRLVLAQALAWACGPARAQAWPSQALRILVPAGPGSVPDLRARWVAERLAPRLGQPVLAEHRPGAGGLIAMEAVARSQPDGHTLAMVHLGLTVLAPLLLERPGYDWERDFAPITRVGVGPLLLLVGADSPAATVRDLLALSRREPRGLSFASPGIGTPPHLAAEMLRQVAGIEAVHVPYTNPTQPVADLIGGRVHWMVEGTPVALPLVAAGRLRALAVTAPKRLAALPAVPTADEAGLPGLHVEGWTGLAAPAATPAPVIERLYGELARVLASDEARQWFGSVGNEPGGEPPTVLAALIRSERERWSGVIRRAGLAPPR
jgi:tripartite-type tricarboxylate transporter receptor subunit TctC